MAPLSRRLLENLQGDIEKTIDSRVQSELAKMTEANKKEQTYQYNLSPFYSMAVNAQQKPKPEGRVSYHMLRNFSIHYPIARACIDYLKTKILKLDYQIVSKDPSIKINQDDPRVSVVKGFFESPLGPRSGYRQLIESIIEDYLVIGAFALERIKTRGGQFNNELKVVDSATIQILVDEHGRLPLPPNPAYRQVINGEAKVELTQDDILYVTRGYRSNSPYGVSPIESIIVQSESALQGAMYSLRYFTDGNVPEGFGEMPEGWTTQQIREFQDYFDMLISGNSTVQRKIKMVPKGFNYQPVKKPDALGFDRFEGWLLQQTCSVFGVPPHDIGFNANVYKQDGQAQQELGEERGMRPLAQLLEQVFSTIISDDMRIPGLIFRYNDLDPVDAKEEAEVMEIKIRSGVMSVDEARQEEGLDPIGLGHYILGSPTLVNNLLQQGEQEEDGDQEVDEQDDDEDVEMDEQQKSELVLWMKSSKNAFRQGRPFKKFQSNVLDEWMIEEIYNQLKGVTKKSDINKVFDPYLDNSIQTVRVLGKLTNALTHLNTTTR